jgi:hypothetical protein
MIKKLLTKVTEDRKRKAAYQWIAEHKVETSILIKDLTVSQLNKGGGIGFGQINNWLQAIRQETIKGYIITKDSNAHVFYELPDMQERARLEAMYGKKFNVLSTANSRTLTSEVRKNFK